MADELKTSRAEGTVCPDVTQVNNSRSASFRGRFNLEKRAPTEQGGE